MFRAVVTVGLLKCAAAADSRVIPLATFDGTQATSWHWETVNDPVMGGQSRSTFTVDATRKLGVWDGEVKIVPFLHAPGFCNLQAPGLNKKAAFPDVSGTGGLTVRARQTNSSGLARFNAQLRTKGARHFFKEGSYQVDFKLTSSMEDHFVSWEDFKCTWRGENVTWCPDLKTQLAQLTNIGVGTAFPGEAAKFHVEIESVSAVSEQAMAAPTILNDAIDLATFDGKAAASQHRWSTENDPVMGGQSDSTFAVSAVGYADYSGNNRIVPSLKAPGFTFAHTEMNTLFARFPDVSSTDGIILGVRNVDANLTAFKFAFCDSRINYYRCQFASFKADFFVPVTSDFSEVFIPWGSFSDKWSPETGAHTAEDPPSSKSLKSITQLQIWTEGIAGHFHLQVKYVRAGKMPALADGPTVLV
jgi:hypothetical protein